MVVIRKQEILVGGGGLVVLRRSKFESRCHPEKAKINEKGSGVCALIDSVNHALLSRQWRIN